MTLKPLYLIRNLKTRLYLMIVLLKINLIVWVRLDAFCAKHTIFIFIFICIYVDVRMSFVL